MESELKHETTEALENWIGSSNWHTPHAANERDFFQFVDAYSREHGNIDDEGALQDVVWRAYERLHAQGEQIDRDNSEMFRILVRRLHLMKTILDFLEETGR